jgi:ABC-type maltose transport system permease subunit
MTRASAYLDGAGAVRTFVRVILPAVLVRFVQTEHFNGVDRRTTIADVCIILVAVTALSFRLGTRIIRGMDVKVGK